MGGRRAQLWAVAILAGVLLAAVLVVPGVARSQEYRIGPLDVLRITVYGQDDLTRTVSVSPEGAIPFPLLGDVPAAGLTPAQLEARLKDLLGKDYLVNPQVTVSVQEYHSQRIFVLGEVMKPGIYPLTGPTTLLDLLSQVGGQTPTAGGQVTIRRLPPPDGPAPRPAVVVRVSLRQLLDGDHSANLALQNGDTVYFAKMTSFFVLGEVQKQGAYAADKDTTILEAITLAGGFSDRAAPAGVKVLRKRADGSQETLEVNLSGADPRARELVLAEGDTVVVPRGNTFFVVGEVKLPGVYLLDPGTTAFTGLTRAGGFTDRAAPTQGRLIRRLSSGEEQTTLVDLSGADPRARDLVLKDGDTLLVPAGNLFFVLGEVGKPGAFQLDRPISAMDAVLLAGGFTPKAAAAQVKLTRRLPSGEEQTTVLDLSGPNARGRDFTLAAGDTLLVPAGNTFYVLGEVKSPGAFQLQDATTAIQGIAMAGGFTDRAAPNRTKIIRTHKDGKQETLVVDLNEVVKRGRKDKDVPLAANDVVVVPESYF